MDEDDVNLPNHQKIVILNKTLVEFRNEYDYRIAVLEQTFSKIYEILEDNNINPKILNNMTFKNVSEKRLEFTLLEKSATFYVFVTLESEVKEPVLTFGVKNEKSGSIVEEILHVYRFDTILSTQFMLIFKNKFKSYYNS